MQRNEICKVIMMFKTLLLWSLLWTPPALCQESPTLFADKFNTSRSYRTDVCDRQRALWNNTLELPDALRGLNLTVVITNYSVPNENKFFTLRDNKIIEGGPGLYAEILDEVARRAGFQWRNSFAVATPLTQETDGNKTWTDILHWGVQTFDISMEKWGYSLGRVALGISFPAGWWDSSVVFVEQLEKSQTKRDVDLWSFLRPFSFTVWGLILAAITLTGVLYWYLEYIDPNADERVLEQKVFAAISTAALTFTQQFEFRPNTPAAQLVTFSFSFWALIVTSAYVANIFSFLSSPVVQVFSIATVDDAINQNAVVCVQANAVIQQIFGEEYPDLTTLGIQGESKLFNGLRKGPDFTGCDAAAHQFFSYQIYQRNKDVNYDCSLKTTGNVAKVIAAGMATAIDTGSNGNNSYCTSLVSHVLDYHLTAMIDDGFVEQAWNKLLNTIGTIECIDEGVGGADDGLEDAIALGLQDLGGIFLLHFLATALSVAMALWEYYRTPRDERKSSMSEIVGIDKAKEVFQKGRNVLMGRATKRGAAGATQGSDRTSDNVEHAVVDKRAEFASGYMTSGGSACKNPPLFEAGAGGSRNSDPGNTESLHLDDPHQHIDGAQCPDEAESSRDESQSPNPLEPASATVRFTYSGDM